MNPTVWNGCAKRDLVVKSVTQSKIPNPLSQFLAHDAIMGWLEPRSNFAQITVFFVFRVTVPTMVYIGFSYQNTNLFVGIEVQCVQYFVHFWWKKCGHAD